MTSRVTKFLFAVRGDPTAAQKKLRSRPDNRLPRAPGGRPAPFASAGAASNQKIFAGTSDVALICEKLAEQYELYCCK
jgi:hypothetical protein